jgi:hypothetical protein
MASVAFWMSFAAVFLGVRWLADAAFSAGQVEVRRVRPVVDVPRVMTEETRPSVLDEAA